MKSLKLLIVEDNPGDLFIIEEFLANTKLPIERLQGAESLKAAEEYLAQDTYDVIFLDLFLPDGSGAQTFQRINPRNLPGAVIVLSGLQDEKIALEALQHGVQDYVVKGEYDEKILERTVRYAIERKRDQDLLKLSEEKYKILFEGNPIPMWAYDLTDYRIVMVNNSAIRHYGYSREEFLQMTIFDLRTKEDAELLKSYLAEINEKGDLIQSGIWRHKKKNGDIIDVEVVSHRIPWGATTVRLVASYDITERKKAEAHLRLLESAITHANDAVLVSRIDEADPNQSFIIFSNNAFTRMTGYLPEEIIGHNMNFLFGTETDPDEMARLREMQHLMKSAEFEMIHYKKNGEKFWNNFTIVPVTDSRGTSTHWVSIQRDVTSRRQHEEITRRRLEKLIDMRTRELHEALAKEKELVEMKSRFVAIASHEFRTPLSTIGFATNFLQDHLNELPTEEVLSKLKKIEKQVNHMTSLLEDVILVGRNELNKIQVIKSDVPLKAFTDKIVEEVLQSTRHTHRINLTYKVAAQHLHADEKLLRNIFINVLSNAIKFSPGKEEIKVNMTERDNNLHLEVIDEGIGISASDQEHLFEAFYRGSNANQIAGSGLGLSIVKKAVELLEGTLELESEVNKGTRVRIKLPLP
jgi:PAS domain S-box-containing protein